jgi:hypothetical protein
MTNEMNEKFLHFIWKYQLFDKQLLKSTNQENIRIHLAGIHNHDAGPDFANAKIQIEDTIWFGQVEIHIRSSDYFKHEHQHDPAYNNIVLHVVYEHDFATDRLPFPTLELKGKIPLHLIRNYENLLQSKSWIPCQASLTNIENSSMESWLTRLAIERLEVKSKLVEQLLSASNQDWESVFYQMLCRCMGMQVNADAFLELARRVPYKILLRHRHSLLQIEALLLGTAGLLNDIVDDLYVVQLQREFQHLQHKYEITAMNKQHWKFSRMRPANFPTIKIAQLATLFYSRTNLFSKILAVKSPAVLRLLFSCQVSDYWTRHYHWAKVSKKQSKNLSSTVQDLLIINAVVPMLFTYGQMLDDETFIDNAMSLLEQVQAESNGLLVNWQKLGIDAKTALHGQALIQLKKNYCDLLKCESCQIGMKLLNRMNPD